MLSSSSETVRVEALWAAYEEETVLGALALEKMAKAPALTGAAGANASPCTSGSRMNEPSLA
jgi:hypothetical protein